MFNQVSENIVIVVNFIDPSVFGEKWYIKNNIFNVDDILDNKTVIANHISLVHSKDLHIQISNEQIAIFLQNYEYKPEVISKIREIIEKIFKSNESSVIIAVGINFSFESPEMENCEAVTKKLQFSETLELHKLLAANNMRFGSYISKDYLNTRLRIDIKPFFSLENKGQELLKINFNYHRAIDTENKIEEVFSVIENWNSVKEYALKTVNDITNIINS